MSFNNKLIKWQRVASKTIGRQEFYRLVLQRRVISTSTENLFVFFTFYLRLFILFICFLSSAFIKICPLQPRFYFYVEIFLQFLECANFKRKCWKTWARNGSLSDSLRNSLRNCMKRAFLCDRFRPLVFLILHFGTKLLKLSSFYEFMRRTASITVGATSNVYIVSQFITKAIRIYWIKDTSGRRTASQSNYQIFARKINNITINCETARCVE